MNPRPLTLSEGQAMAAKIVERLTPFSDRIAVAGSIRRGTKEMVGDIDIVVLPKVNQEAAFRERCTKREGVTVVTNAAQTLVVILPNQVQVDIWIASHTTKEEFFTIRPCNFGSLLLCRTGSKAHNIHLIQRAKELGKTWNPQWGVFDYTGRNCIAADTEEEIFKALELDFVPPERRER